MLSMSELQKLNFIYFFFSSYFYFLLSYFLFVGTCQVQFTPGWKSVEWTWRCVDLWNDLGFSLYTALSVYCIVVISDDREKSKIGVSAEWCVTIEHIRVIFVNHQTSKLQCNY